MPVPSNSAICPFRFHYIVDRDGDVDTNTKPRIDESGTVHIHNNPDSLHFNFQIPTVHTNYLDEAVEGWIIIRELTWNSLGSDGTNSTAHNKLEQAIIPYVLTCLKRLDILTDFTHFCLPDDHELPDFHHEYEGIDYPTFVPICPNPIYPFSGLDYL